MKTLMLTTAMLLTSAGALAAQTPTPAPAPADTTAAVVVEGNDPPAIVADAAPIPAFRVSDFTGKSLYVLNPDIVTQLRGTATYDERTARWTSGETFIAGREQWQDIGTINDVIMTQDGQLRGVLLDIGGFLGIGARTVMVDIGDLYFVADSTTPDDLDDFFTVASLSREQLEALPEWNDENLAVGYPSGADVAPAPDGAMAPVTDPAAVPADTTTTAPMAEATLPTAEELTGADVQDAAGNSIGTVGDLVLEGDRLTGARIDVGGFLGIGTRDVIVPIEALSVTRTADGGVDHVQTSLSRTQLEALPAQN